MTATAPHPDDLAWMSDGLCTQVDPRVWDGIEDQQKRRICSRCPVQVQCREFRSMPRAWVRRPQLTDEVAAAIRDAVRRGNTQEVVAKRFRVARSTVSAVVREMS